MSLPNLSNTPLPSDDPDKQGLAYSSKEAYEHIKEGGHKGGQTRAQQLGHEGYEEMGKKGGLARTGQSSGEAAEEQGVEIDESKFRTRDSDKTE
ncbi:hypothetical protein GOP47_0007687 [Adiantum capillus-veneris]|uniref:Uncharacterized protein n=1 Tax=Adiantum capillus-veneris TaxID=13818 RepID=A0A9D4V1D0_ADICA|nr:hypothetical protein GOP47_0007687 [Adiantum capillus-veneris]